MVHYYVTGPDGSGKTSFIGEIASELGARGLNFKFIWIRSPKILSKPLMAYCRFMGLTKYQTINGIKYGKHEFFRSDFVSYVFPYLQLIDFKLKWLFVKSTLKRDQILLFDRFNLDTLADLMVSTRDMNLHKTWVGQKFINLSLENTKLLILNVHEDEIRKRKKDTLFDENLGLKIEAYQILKKDLQINQIDNNDEFQKVKREIFEYLEL